MYDRINAGEFENQLPYAGYRADKKTFDAYMKERDRLAALFKSEALKSVGLENHPKKDIIYSKAWEDGHSRGYSEVYGKLVELAEFIEELSKP